MNEERELNVARLSVAVSLRGFAHRSIRDALDNETRWKVDRIKGSGIYTDIFLKFSQTELDLQ